MSQANRDQLNQINMLIKNGKAAEAKKMLVPLLKAEPDNAAGWWLMANAVSDPEHKRRALQRFLQLRPNDVKGQALLLKLDAPAPADDPFNDPDNPFVAAKKASTSTSTPRKSLLNKASDDDPFGDVEGDDDPFAAAPSTGLRFQAARATGTIPRSTGTIARTTGAIEKPKSAPEPAKSSLTSILIVGGAVVIAFIAIGAAILISGPRIGNSAATGGDPNAYVDPQVYCDDNTSVFNENDDEGARLSSRVDNRGTLRVGDEADGSFAGGNELHGYSFEGQSGQWIVIEMWSPDESIDPQIEVYDPNGEQFAFCDDSSESLDTYMQVRLPRNGRYTIVAQQFVGVGEGSYRISVRER